MSRGQDRVILFIMIMKKTFSALGAFCLGAFITIGVMACAGDDNPEYNISREIAVSEFNVITH